MKLFLGALACLLLATLSVHAGTMYMVDDSETGCFFNSHPSSQIITLDMATGKETVINSGTGHKMTDIAVSNSGLYTIAEGSCGKYSLYKYTQNGVAAGSWNLGISNYLNSLVMLSPTSMLMMASDSKHIWQANLNSSGNLSSVVDLGKINAYSTGDIAISPTGQVFFIGSSNANSSVSKLYTLAFNNGIPKATLVGTLKKNGKKVDSVYGLAFDENGMLFCGAKNDNLFCGSQTLLYSVNTSTGALTEVHNFKQGDGLNGLAYAVPEPASMAILAAGLLLVRRFDRRK